MSKAYEYARWAVKSKEVPRYVKKQCRVFIKIADGKDSKYFLDKGYRVECIDGSLELSKLASEYLGIDVKCMNFFDFDEVSKVASHITKVPGGVGPMTICCLMENTIECFMKHMEK